MTHANTTAIIQARMGSKRLPGKVLLDIAGQPMLARVVERTRLAKTIDQVIVATTTEPDVEPIVDLCAARGYPCFQGSLQDVLDRYYQAARAYNAETVVRITADCPLIDPGVIDKTVYAFWGVPEEGWNTRNTNLQLTSLDPRSSNQLPDAHQPYDFAANRLPPPWGRTYPIGLDTEVCSFEALEIAWKEAEETHQREHVMPFFYDHPERFRTLLINHEVDYGDLRWTVDTSEDLELVRQIFTRFPGKDDFSWLEVIDIFKREPKLAEINARVRHKHYLEVDSK